MTNKNNILETLSKLYPNSEITFTISKGNTIKTTITEDVVENDSSINVNGDNVDKYIDHIKKMSNSSINSIFHGLNSDTSSNEHENKEAEEFLSKLMRGDFKEEVHAVLKQGVQKLDEDVFTQNHILTPLTKPRNTPNKTTKKNKQVKARKTKLVDEKSLMFNQPRVISTLENEINSMFDE